MSRNRGWSKPGRLTAGEAFWTLVNWDFVAANFA